MKYINEDLYRDIMSSSNVVGGKEYRELVCTIAQIASDMVVKTLGPYGSTTVIDEGTGFTYPSKDGWTCLSKLQFTDPTYNNIFQMLKKISFNSVTTVGDGTTTAMVAANNFLKIMYEKFIPEVEKDGAFRQASFIHSMEKIYRYLEKLLRENPNVMTIDTEGDYLDIFRIAHIATNGNSIFSGIIQEIYQETKNPNIQVELDPNSSDTTYVTQIGYKFASHVLSFHAYVNDGSGSIIFKDKPRRVVIFDHTVSFQSHEKIIGGLLGLSNRDDFDLVLMAPYFDDIISTWIGSQVENCINQRQYPRIMLIQIPLSTTLQRKTLSDLCALTNSQIFDEPKTKAFNILYHNQTHDKDQQINDPMFQLKDYTFDGPEDILQRCLGTIQSIILDKNEGFIQDYENVMNKQTFDTVVREAKEDYEERKRKAVKTIGGTLDKDYMFSQMRYIKLTGSTGVIKVGAVSDIQQRTDKDTIDDAVLACKSAFENGYVRGMNLEILTILKKLIDKSIPHIGVEYEDKIYDMLYSCFYLTTLEVMNNKHRDESIRRRVRIKPEFKAVSDEVTNLSSGEIIDICTSDKRALDYNLRTEVMSPIGRWDVINSTATDIEILRAVVNVLTTIITSNQYISVTKRFDVNATNEKTLTKRLEEEYRYSKSRADGFMDALSTNENYDLLQGLVGGVRIFGEYDDQFDEPMTLKEDPGISGKDPTEQE
jgi:hypothetical protein